MIYVDLRSFMIKKVLISKNVLHILFGTVLSAFILLQAIHTHDSWVDPQEQSDQSDSEAESETSFLLPQTIPNTATQINLGFDSYLLDEVELDDNSNARFSTSELIAPRIHKAIKVLLMKIVTPNAP